MTVEGVIEALSPDIEVGSGENNFGILFFEGRFCAEWGWAWVGVGGFAERGGFAGFF
jgi:hypothetical protein